VNAPLYLQVQMDILAAISSGAYAAGDMLPTESEFCEQYGVSRATVRRAIENLSVDGIVVKQHGVGTFVQKRPTVGQSVRFRGYLDDILILDPENHYQLVSIETRTFPEEIAKIFGGDEFATGTVSLNLLRRKGRSVMVGERYLPTRIAEYEQHSDYETGEQPTVAILKKAGIRIARGHQIMKAVTASQKVAGLLGVSQGTPLMASSRTYHDIHDKAVAVIEAIYHPTNFEMFIDLAPKMGGRFL